MLGCLYNIIIEPIEFLFRYIFIAIYRVTDNSVISLVGLSLAVSFITLPLYMLAEKCQNEENAKRKSMEKWVKRIHETFKGDERYYVEQAYYKEQNYKPIYSLKSSASLFLQIPFFIAAYNYLSGLKWVFSASLDRADALLKIGSISINVLPIIMTVINLISGIIYSHGMKWKEKWQIFVLPLVFLVLLYNSKAALVLYWIFNNVFSLIKNIVIKAGKADKVMKIVAVFMYAGGMILFAVYLNSTVIKMSAPVKSLTFIVTTLVALYSCLIPAVILNRKKNKKKEEIKSEYSDEKEALSFGKIVITEAALFVLMAVYIPYTVFSASPTEIFGSNLDSIRSVTIFGICFFAGVFLLWGNVILLLSEKSKRVIVGKIYMIIFYITVFDFFVFKADLGFVNPVFRFDRGYNVRWFYILLSIAAFILCLAFVIYMVMKHSCLMYKIIALLVISMIGISAYNAFKTVRIVKEHGNNVSEISSNDSDKIFNFSKNGKNVVVIMLDRAIGAYVPYIFDEKPELEKSYDGFVFYPNTVSMGGGTATGAYELFGGYEYTPMKLGSDDEAAVSKRAEALQVMPVLFSRNDYKVMVSDLPTSGMASYDEMQMFNKYDGIESYYLSKKYEYLDYDNISEAVKTNLVSFTLLKAAPVFAQNFLYDDGMYFNSSYGSASGTIGLGQYYMLDHLIDMTSVNETENNYFSAFENELTHTPMELKLPDYSWEKEINNDDSELVASHVTGGKEMKMSESSQYTHYHVNMASLIMLGRWFDYLKEQGVYDNTRIIIASDHGYALGQFEDFRVNDVLDIQQFNCLLMVKDFNSKGFETRNDLMCNADTPWLAVKDLIEDAKNPFTGKILSEQNKNEEPFYVLVSEEASETLSGTFYMVQDNVLDKNNWTEK